MTWRDLLFLHLPVDADAVRAGLPPGLDVDTFDGRAWIGVVPFVMCDVAPRCVPALPGVSRFPEFNVRTYVRHRDRPGVWFYSLDAASRVGVRLARRLFRLPYFDAAMEVRAGENGDSEREADSSGGVRVEGPEGARVVRYRSTRTHRGQPRAAFEAVARETGPAERAAAGTLDAWLTERYALYAASPSGNLLRGEIHHEPWPLRPVDVDVSEDSLARAAGFDLSMAGEGPDGAPIAHFVREIRVVAWWLESLGRSGR